MNGLKNHRNMKLNEGPANPVTSQGSPQPGTSQSVPAHMTIGANSTMHSNNLSGAFVTVSLSDPNLRTMARTLSNGGPSAANGHGYGSIAATDGSLQFLLQNAIAHGSTLQQNIMQPFHNNFVSTQQTVNILGQVINNGPGSSYQATSSTENYRPLNGDSISNGRTASRSQTNLTTSRTSSPIISNGRSELFNFFASINPAFVWEDGQAAAAIPDALPSPGTPATPAAHQRPKDLLRHFFNGRTIFETASGLPFTPEQLAYVSNYYTNKSTAEDLDAVLAEPNPPQELKPEKPTQEVVAKVVERVRPPSQPVERPKPPPPQPAGPTKQCEFCKEFKPLSMFQNSMRFCQKECAKRYNVSCKLTSKTLSPKTVAGSQPSTSAQKQPVKKATEKAGAEFKLKSGRKKRTEVSVESKTDMLLKQAKRPNIGSVNLAKTDMGNVEFPGGKDVTKGSEETTVPGVDSDVLRAAPLVNLLRSKPDLEKWTVGDISVLLESIRGLSPFVPTFVEGEIDGQALGLLLVQENMIDEMKLARCLAYKLQHFVQLFKSKSFVVEDVLHLL